MSIQKAVKSSEFISDHKLWQGLNSYKWLSKLSFIAAVLFGLYFVGTAFDWISKFNEDQVGVLQAASGAFSEVFVTLKDFFLAGSFKYVILVLIEVVIFHFVRRTLMVVTGENIDTSFATFMTAQKRMIGVAIYALIMESVFSFLVKIPFWFTSFDFFEPVIVFLVQAFFTGFVIIDNYNEVYHMTIRQSARYAWLYAAVTTIVGGIVFLIMHIPLIGPVLGPVLGAVIAALSLHTLYLKDRNMDWVYEIVSKRTRKRRKSSIGE